MRLRGTLLFSGLSSVVGLFALASCVVASAQDIPVLQDAKPKYVVLRGKPVSTPPPPVALKTWNGSFVHASVTYPFTMVGSAPVTGTSTTVPAIIIPLKIIVLNGGVPVTFDPKHVLPDGNTVNKATAISPIFDKTTNYTQGGVNLGTTQYIDAFQRGNFWGTVSLHPSYHVLLGGPTFRAEQTLNVPASEGFEANAFGVNVAVVNINWFDSIIQPLLTKLVAPNQIAIFLTYDTYLSENSGLSGCCIGGYHSFTGTQAYIEATYVDQPGAFAQDVSALSHEVGEFVDDPIGSNPVPLACGIGAVLEVGDPEEGFANYGAFPYTVNGFTYNLQDLVFLPYFGAPSSRSLNGWLTFQDNPFGLGFCSNGG